MTRFSMSLLLMAVALSCAAFSAEPAPNPAEELARAEAPVTEWDGPVEGPPASPNKTIVCISADLRNGGILGVANGIREAAKAIGWKVKILDLHGGELEACTKAAEEAVSIKAHGVILIGMDALKNAKAWEALTKANIPVLGWHTGAANGPIAGTPVRLNVTTDALAVARIAGRAAVESRRGKAGIVIFTDSNYAIALAKSDAMAAVVRASPDCELLEVRDVHLSEAAKVMPEVTRELLAKHGSKWTHALGINDLYFDHATPVFAVAGLPADSSIACISAGDGSISAYARIQAGLYQTATVAEPLHLQGWQLVDEMNRIFSGAPLSGYVTPVHLVNAKNITRDGGAQRRFDPENGYRNAYRKIWRR